MSVVSITNLENSSYKVSITAGTSTVETLLVCNSRVYTVVYKIKNNTYTKAGRITNIIYNKTTPENTYMAFDNIADDTSRKERIYLNQVTSITDITPDSAYVVATDNGYVGTEAEWLKSLIGRGITSIARTSGTGATGTTDVYTITYSDNTNSTFNVYNGADGVTPVRGTDYWTEADKAEMKSYIDAYIDSKLASK